MAWSQRFYSDFSGGINDSAPEISIADNEFVEVADAEFSSVKKAVCSRKGVQYVEKEAGVVLEKVTDLHTWTVSSEEFLCYVRYNDNDSKYYFGVIQFGESSNTSPVTEIEVASDKIYPFEYGNKFYFGDGTNLYVVGAYDYSASVSDTSKEVKQDDLVCCGFTTSPTNLKGKFYEYIGADATIDFSSTDYTTTGQSKGFEDTTKWTDVTLVKNFVTNIAGEMDPPDGNEKEKVKLTVGSGYGSMNCEIALTLGNDPIDGIASGTSTYEFTLNGTYSTIEDVSTAIYNLIIADTDLVSHWDVTHHIYPNYTTLEAKVAGPRETGGCVVTVLGSSPRLVMSYVTETEGSTDSCDLTPIKKCTNFCVHYGSYRVFATGNPEDNALYYSEIGEPNYFISATNKLYPSISGFGKITGMLNLSDYLLVSYENGWYSWTGTTPLTDAYWKPLNIPYGCVAQRTIAMIPNGFVFLSKTGLYKVSSSILYIEAFVLQSKAVLKNLTEDRVRNVIKDFLANGENCAGVFYDNAYYLTETVPVSNTSDNTVRTMLKYDWNTESFTTFNYYSSLTALATSGSGFYSSLRKLPYSVASDVITYKYGTIHQLETGKTNNYYTTISGYQNPHLHFKTKRFYFGSPLNTKLIQHIVIIFKAKPFTSSSDSMTADLTAHVATSNADTETTLNHVDDGTAMTWSREWGLDWGETETLIKMYEFGRACNTIQLEFDAESTDEIVVIGIGFIYEEVRIDTPKILNSADLLT